MSGALTPEVRREQDERERFVRADTLQQVAGELYRQDVKWGVPEAQTQTPERRFTILLEEVGEVADALCNGPLPTSSARELVQVAAIAVANAQRVRQDIDGLMEDRSLEAHFVWITRELGLAARSFLEGDRADVYQRLLRVEHLARTAQHEITR